jgi:hypothetical protein
MKRLLSLLTLMGLIGFLLACGGTATPDSEATTQAAVVATLAARPTETATPAPTSAPIPTELPTDTPDPCSGATAAGARERFAFEEIVPCLDTPQKVRDFMSGNLRWDGGWDAGNYGDNAYSPAWEVYANGVDDCDGLAEFGACVLSRNGYEAYNVGVSILGPLGHNVTGFVGADGLEYAIHNGQRIDGPFDTWEELAQFYIDNGSAAPDGVIWLFQPCIGERAVGDAVLNVPHTVIR